MLARNYLTAEQLKLTDAQHAALIQVLGMLERGELVELDDARLRRRYEPNGFSMGNWCYCICGWANKVSNPAKLSYCDYNYSPVFARGRYDPPYPLFIRTGLNMEQATNALRDYLTTGAL